jgi:YidC/Oxa1 family membrane protein insertase
LVVTFLTKSGGLLGPINSLLGLIMNGIYEFFSLFGVHNIALSIIVFTFITRTLMLPLTIKQQKFTKLSSKMNPELQKIQAKYKGKKDEASLRKQQAETQVVYQKFGANPTSGCLPMLISLPVMFSLYQVINNIPGYVSNVKRLYQPVAKGLMQIGDYETTLAEMGKGLRVSTTNLTDVDHIINVLYKFKTKQWSELATSFPDLTATIATAQDKIHEVNGFFNLNIANSPDWKTFAIIIPILAAGLSYIQSRQLQVKNKGNNQDNPTAAAMNSMNVVMPIMQFFFCIMFPIGIGIYWIATSVYTITQQYFVNKYLDRVDVDELIEKNVAKATKRKAYLEKNGVSLEELAKKQTKSIESYATKSIDKTNSNDSQDSTEQSAEETTSQNQSSSGPKSISEIANLLKNRNEKGDK